MFFSKLNVCSPPRSVRFGTESSQVHSITIFHRGSILLPQFHCKASLIIVSSGLFQRSTFSTRAWRQPCSWTSTWKRTRSSNWTKRLARIRASSRWLFLETESYFVFSSFPFDVCDKRHNMIIAQVNFKKLENSVKDRVEQYVTLQHSGDKEAVDK